jgi:ERCC4-type nuclease
MRFTGPSTVEDFVTLRIIADTREQKPLEPFVLEKNERVYIPTVRAKLDEGDYAIEGHEQTIFIERKSVEDLYGTITQGRDRFCAELLRVVEANRADSVKYSRRYVVIEGGWNDLDMYILQNGRRCPLSTINSNVTALSLNYGVDFVWCEKYGRTEAEWFVGFVCSYVYEQMTSSKAAEKARGRGLELPWLRKVDE